MKRYLIRKNCEYSIEIDAEDEDAALSQADAAKSEDWIEAWSSLEVDSEDELSSIEERCHFCEQKHRLDKPCG